VLCFCIVGRVRTIIFYLLDHTKKRLSSWKANSLSFSGRLTLTQAVIETLPTYTMHVTLLPMSVCTKLERMAKDFVWGHDSESRRWHTIAWESFCHPKKDMRMGLKHVHIFNKALVMKRG